MEQNTTNRQALAETSQPPATTTQPYTNAANFELMQRVAKAFAASDLLPSTYKNNVSNCMIALEMANRMGTPPLMVMQNLHVINGRPSWGSPFIIGMVNTCGKFKTDLKFELTGDGNDRTCVAYTTDNAGVVCRGTPVSIQMAITEGWATKAGSKWKTMPEQMLIYRAAAFFSRVYCPELLMGMQSQEEAMDISKVDEPIVLSEDQLSKVRDTIKAGKPEEARQVLEQMNITPDQAEIIQNDINLFDNGTD